MGVIVLVVADHRAVTKLAVAGRSIAVTIASGRTDDRMVVGMVGIIPAPAVTFGVRNLRDGNCLNGMANGRIDSINGDAAVDDVAVVDVVIVDDGGLMKNLRGAFVFLAEIARMAFAQMADRNKSEKVRA